MSRHKTEASIEREREQKIRRERRALKRATQEERQVARELRRKRHEAAAGGLPRIETNIDNFTYAAIRNFYPLQRCEACGRFVREDWMATPTVCIACYEGGKLEGSEDQESKGGALAPGQRQKKTRPQRRAEHHQKPLYPEYIAGDGACQVNLGSKEGDCA